MFINYIIMSQRSLAAARSRRAPIEPPKSNQRSLPPPPVSSQKTNGLPFSKLSISDAIGLITLRLGKVESFLIEQQNNPSSNIKSTIMENTLDNTLLTSLNRRVEELEKKNSIFPLDDLISEVDNIKSQFQSLVNDYESRYNQYDNSLLEIQTKFMGNDDHIITQNDENSNIIDEDSIVDNEENAQVMEENIEQPSKKKGGRRKKINV